MACPNCKCKVTYSYDPEWDGMGPSDDRLERCAACRHVFDVEDHADEDDEPVRCRWPECGCHTPQGPGECRTATGEAA